MSTLKDTKIGETVTVINLHGEGALRQHFLDMGIIPGTDITVVKYAPMGDPIELRLHGYELTLRLADADKINVVPSENSADSKQKKKKSSRTEHPRIGEHSDGAAADKKLTFALVGNQNSGKTTLFNRLTGSNQHVGNFPGVTVDRKDGAIKGYPNTRITDLPGIYSMSPYSSEEIVSRNFVLDEKPDAIINIVDVTNIERNLYLTMQLLELDIPVVIALNMMDELTANGGSVDINRMEKMLGTPVVPISAAKNEGIEELVTHAINIAQSQVKPLKQDFCEKNENGGTVHRCLHGIAHLIEDHAERTGIPIRFAASKIIEGDTLIGEKLGLDKNELETMEHIVAQLEKERNLDRSAAIADMRFSYIMSLCSETVKKPQESRERLRSKKIDEVLTGKYTAIPMFILIMGAVFYLTFNVIGAWLQGLIEEGVDLLTEKTDTLLTNLNVNDTLHSLVIDGIFAGVGSVLSFLPIIVTLFFFLSMLEDSGYIARVAFFMDKLLRKIGLSGRSIVPMLVGFGCTVPAVMATRTLPSERDRKMTILLTPFMSCTAKLPIYAFFVDAFFPEYKALIMIGVYLLGILLSIFAALLYKGSLFRGEPVPFVMELPNYRMPGARNVLQLLWEKAKDFLQRAFSVILIATIVVWFLTSFDMHMNLTENKEESILAAAAGIIAPIFKPVGLGDWKICVALVSGFMAKEGVVSMLEVLYEGGVQTAMTAVSAAALLVFSLLYTPCVAAVAAIKREMGSKWAAAVVLWQCAVAWVFALIVNLIGMAIGG